MSHLRELHLLKAMLAHSLALYLIDRGGCLVPLYISAPFPQVGILSPLVALPSAQHHTVVCSLQDKPYVHLTVTHKSKIGVGGV